ncbi:hypothetical protein LAZ67_20002166 [Cordylochernes scorpioides]|uniref:Uncharacterized protein n=1 Tax=Cordylochernes scorpioides TaxID=51811 RepID=A0ABY6LNG7_9ARAC|nr:hypothetical protein LAZ67_20002166 [Cordylochernes scorpioides]
MCALVQETMTPLRAVCPRDKPRAHHSRGDRRQEAPLRHVGKHSQRGQQDGEHGQSRPHPDYIQFIRSYHRRIHSSAGILMPESLEI